MCLWWRVSFGAGDDGPMVEFGMMSVGISVGIRGVGRGGSESAAVWGSRTFGRARDSRYSHSHWGRGGRRRRRKRRRRRVGVDCGRSHSPMLRSPEESTRRRIGMAGGRPLTLIGWGGGIALLLEWYCC